MLVLLGLTWESAKLYFGPIGLRGLGIGGPGQRFGSLMLAVMALMLMAGSVVASMAYLSQADAQDQQRVLTSSRAYAESQELLRSLDTQIEVLSVAASRDVAQNFRKRALATSDTISGLRRQRADASAATANMEAHPDALASTPFIASMGALLPGEAVGNGKRIRCISHAVIAVMLELIGVAALCVARSHLAATEMVQRGITGAPGAFGESIREGQRSPEYIGAPGRCTRRLFEYVGVPGRCTCFLFEYVGVLGRCTCCQFEYVGVPGRCTCRFCKYIRCTCCRREYTGVAG